MGKKIDLTGQIFNKLTILNETSSPTHLSRKTRHWLCQCSCGNIITRSQANLVKNTNNFQACKICANKHINIINTKHGKSNTRLYKIYTNMLDRCNNINHSSYPNYGKKGVYVCKEWSDTNKGFLAFKQWALNNGYKNYLTIDRIKGNKIYSSTTCEWSTATIQSRNRNKEKNVTSKYIGVYFKKDKNKWETSINVNKQKIFLGYFFTEKEAAQKRDNYIINNNLYGFRLNFKEA